MNDLKSKLRNELKHMRSEMTGARRALLSERISENLISGQVYKDSDTLLCYVSTDIEVDTVLIIRSALEDGKRLAVPRCLPGRKMEFGVINSTSELVAGAYGIMEPPAGCEVVDPSDTSKALCIVPGLAFDEDGFRLGFGGGYYDRYLPQFRGTACGICYEDSVYEQLPRGEYDRPVGLLVTDKKTRRFDL